MDDNSSGFYNDVASKHDDDSSENDNGKLPFDGKDTEGDKVESEPKD
jgi:hypothetical protein